MDFPQAEAQTIAIARAVDVRSFLGQLPGGLVPDHSDREAVMSTFHKSSGAHAAQIARRILGTRWMKASSLSIEYSTANFTETT